MEVKKYPISDISNLINDDTAFNEFVGACPFGEWYVDEIGNVFIIMLDDESDPFILYIIDNDLHGFNWFTSNTYLSLNSRILLTITLEVERVCEEFDWDSLLDKEIN